MSKATIRVKSYIRNGKRIKAHKRTLPDEICSNNLKPKLCRKK